VALLRKNIAALMHFNRTAKTTNRYTPMMLTKIKVRVNDFKTIKHPFLNNEDASSSERISKE